MPFVIVALTLFAAFKAVEANTETDGSRSARLAKMFSPILILTEETRGVSGALLRATGTYSDRPGRQVHHRGPGRGRPSKWAVTDSTQVDSGQVDSGDEGAGKRTLRRMAFGSAMTIAAGLIGVQQIRKDRDEDDGDEPGLEGLAAFVDYGIGLGWPVGVYLADPWESSFWMTAVGHGVAWRFGGNNPGSLWGIMGWTLIVSEASRSAPKGIRKPLQWLFEKFRQPDARVSFGLVPEPRRGLSARATLRF